MKAAADAGATAWSSATFYGNPGDPYANIKLIARFFEKASTRTAGAPARRIAADCCRPSPFRCNSLADIVQYPEYSDKVTLAIKGGITPDLKPAKAAELEKLVRGEIAEIQSILGKERAIDVYVLARLHPQSEVEDAMRVLKGLQDEGVLGSVGVSEMKGETVERALKVSRSAYPSSATMRVTRSVATPTPRRSLVC
jgi:pyridoxine 4-dehydrogenase